MCKKGNWKAEIMGETITMGELFPPSFAIIMGESSPLALPSLRENWINITKSLNYGRNQKAEIMGEIRKLKSWEKT